MLFCLIIVTLLDLVWSNCSSGWIRHQDTCYHFSHDKENWVSAMFLCKDMGGILAEITDQTEGTFLSSTILRLKSTPYWIGGSDIANEGEWQWHSTQQSILSQSYQNWHPGDPANALSDENCLEITHDGTWNDVACSHIQNYVCQIEDESVSQIIG